LQDLRTNQIIQTSILLHQYPLVAKRFFDICGSADQIFAMISGSDRGGLKIPSNLEKKLKGISEREHQQCLLNTLAWLESPRHNLVHLGSPNYPELLAQIPDPPLLLYVVGDPALLARPQLAIVGSRNPTQYGRRVTRLFAQEIAQSGIIVTSGMARGIDSIAHRGALDAGCPTVAVLGTGCDQAYPRENRGLMDEIASLGLLVSEFPHGTGPAATNFPQRNRIVTGLSCGTVVVEARVRSGSLISARLAMEQGRSVFAVPGSVLSKQSEGCHHLLKEGAQLTASVSDIIEELSISHPELRFHTEDGVQSAISTLSEREQFILGSLDLESISIDKINELTGIPVTEILQTLVRLELLGFINSSGGGYQLGVDWKRT
jgi:DNA processing protein